MPVDFKDPQNPIEWQAAVDAAEAYLLFDSATKYGLVRGGPVVNVHRCEYLLAKGKERGVVPLRENVDNCIAAIVAPRLGDSV